MAEREVNRRLAAIVAADVSGYSRLIASDEEGTLSALRAHRTELIDPKIAEYGGRIANTAGDSVLVEFPSVVEALRCVLDVQRVMTERNVDVAENRRIEFRVGINLGDVVEQDGDLLGDGVNVAARIEALADPGGICLSRAARDQVRDRMEVALEDLGEVEVKNISRPVRVFRVPGLDDARTPLGPTSTRKWLAVAAALLVAIMASGGLWWWQSLPGVEPANMAHTLPAKPSIAVLPFQNLSGDPEQSYFADGMAEDIITDLSKFSGLFVIARNSSFTYKGRQVKVRQVAEELGVRYVLEGSVRRAGDKVRINAQLIDATSGGHLWADRYDGRLADVFKLQDKVTAQIIAALSLTLTGNERKLAEDRETAMPEAYDAFLTAWHHFHVRELADYRKALTWLNKAIDLDPGYSRAWALLASIYHEAWERDWSDQLGIDPKRIPELLERALRRPTPLAYRIKAERLMSRSKWDEAETWIDKASALDPNDSETYVLRSTLVAIQGDTERAIALMETAMRLNPHYPAFYLSRLGAVHLRAGDANQAIPYFERAHKRNPGDWTHLVYLAVAYVEDSRLEDAKRTAKTLVQRRRDLGFLVTLAASFDVWWGFEGTFRDRVKQALLTAGLPAMPRTEDLNLSPKHLLSGADLRAAMKAGYRAMGRVPDGIWMRDIHPDGSGAHYWNDQQTSTTVSVIKGDEEHSERSTGRTTRCLHYRNPEGTKENLDEFISVCAHGIYPYAVLPLPETKR